MRLIKYIKDTGVEMKYVKWPTKKQATAYTILVIVLSLVVAFYIGALDQLFTFLIKLI